MRMIRIPNQPVDYPDGETHYHTVVREERDGESGFETYSFDSRRPLTCEKCIASLNSAVAKFRKTLSEKYSLPDNFWD